MAKNTQILTWMQHRFQVLVSILMANLLKKPLSKLAALRVFKWLTCLLPNMAGWPVYNLCCWGCAQCTTCSVSLSATVSGGTEGIVAVKATLFSALPHTILFSKSGWVTPRLVYICKEHRSWKALLFSRSPEPRAARDGVCSQGLCLDLTPTLSRSPTLPDGDATNMPNPFSHSNPREILTQLWKIRGYLLSPSLYFENFLLLYSHWDQLAGECTGKDFHIRFPV